MKPVKIALVATGIVLLVSACGSKGPAGPVASGSSAPSSVTPGPDESLQPKKSAPVAAGGLLVAIRTEHNADHDRLILEFGGTTAPGHTIKYVDEVREDPSDRLVTLRGTTFLQMVLDGGTLDTSPRESDPNKVQRYPGPRRISPDLPLIKEVAVTGDFEAHLSFGVGLSRKADFKVQTLSAPARVVIEFR